MPNMRKITASDLRQLAQINCFKKATWIAFSAAILFLMIDAYAMFWMPHHSAVDGVSHSAATLFSVTLWALEIAIAILGLVLLGFAFLEPAPYIPSDGKGEVQRLQEASR